MKGMRGREKINAPKPGKFVKAAGGATEVANQLGITEQAVRQWVVVPADRVLVLENMIEKRFDIKTKYDRHDMRPDVFGSRPRKTRAKA